MNAKRKTVKNAGDDEAGECEGERVAEENGDARRDGKIDVEKERGTSESRANGKCGGV